MKDTKSKILSVSKTLFNDQGYSNVTIRMIALELEMSSGNLNYHFKKREEILEALYFEMVSAFDDRVKQLGAKKISLETIKEDITTSLRRMIEYRFFWTDLYNLLRLNKKIKTHFKKAYYERVKGYEFLFNYLIDNGTLKNFEFEKESTFLIERMIGFSNTWIYNSLLYDNKIKNDYTEQQAKNLLSILFPYLTDSGKKEYKVLFVNYFK